MTSCELQKPIVHGAQMDRWLGLSERHDPLFPNLTLKPNSEHRLAHALNNLEHVKDIGNVHGRRSLKNVLQCFEPVSALRTPPNKHTGGDTLYGQVAAAYDAYRTGMLDSEAMKTVENFTDLVLFAVAGKTNTPNDYVSSLTYEEELFAGSIEKTHYETDALGEQALRTLDRVHTLFANHRQHIDNDTTRQKHRYSTGLALPAKVTGALVAIELFITGCTTAVSPTISPTTEATKPAMTAPLPTVEPSKTPTITPAPTEAPTPTAIAKPDTSSNYPGAVSDRLLTDTRLQEHKTAFATLVKSNSDVASEARTMETRLKLICGNTCTTEGVLDQARWGIIARNSDGTPLVLQKTTDGGKTWVNVVDASAYSELVANAKFDKANYKLTQLQRPSGIPEDATGEVMTQNNWMVYVWRDKTTGKILAWYDAANDQYLTVEGKKLALEIPYTPFEPGVTTWETAKKNVVAWPLDDPEQFKTDLAKLHAFDIPVEPNVDLISRLRKQILYTQNTGAPEGWLQIQLRTESRTTAPNASIIGYLENPLGNEMQIVMTQFTVSLKDGSTRAFSIPVVQDTTLLLNRLRENNIPIDKINLFTETKFVESFWNYDTTTATIIFARNTITSDQLNNNWKLLAQLYDYNYDLGVIQRLDKLLLGEGTDEDIEYIIQNGLIPVYRILAEDDPVLNPTEKNP